MLIVNIMGEPGAGKSVTSAGLFYELSVRGIRAEIINEVAKGYAWETPKDPISGKALIHPIFKQQVFLFGEQNRVLERVIGQRDVAIMECPLLLMAIYAPENYFKNFEELVIEQFHKYNNFNILLERSHSFDSEGRIHDETQSNDVKEKLQKFLEKYNIPHIKLKTHKNIHQEIFEIMKEKNLLKKF